MFTHVLDFDLIGEVIGILHMLCTPKDNLTISHKTLAINFAKPSLSLYMYCTQENVHSHIFSPILPPLLKTRLILLFILLN